MAIVLKFRQGDSGTELSLNSATAGFSLAGWSPAVATPVHMSDPAPIGESIHLNLKQADQNTIATSMQSLHEMQVLADRYINDPTQENPVWLHAKMANETGERRALVYSITAQYKSSWFGAAATSEDIPLVISVVRGPYWERTVVRNLPYAAPSAAACVVYDYTAQGAGSGNLPTAHDIMGDVGARVGIFDIQDNGTDIPTRFWMGIRSAGKHGANGITFFEPIWECEDGINLDADDVADEADATASDGNRVTVTEVGTNWDDGDFHDVLRLPFSLMATAPEECYGNFLWLLRTMCSAGSTTWEIKLLFAYGNPTNDEDWIIEDIIEIDETAWVYKEATQRRIPLRDRQALTDGEYPSGNDPEDLLNIKIIARRTSGTADLYLDCLIPLPVDEGFIKLDYNNPVTTDNFFTFGQSPQRTIQALLGNGSDLVRFGQVVSYGNFYLPPGDGRIYCVYEQETGSDITDNIFFQGDVIAPNINFGKYYESWLSLRGGE